MSNNEEFCIENQKLCIKNEELCIKNDEFCRFIYIAAITAVNPIVTQYVADHTSAGRSTADGTVISRHSLPALAAFGVGCSAGLLSAPCQTMNALMKSEAHRANCNLNANLFSNFPLKMQR